MTSAAPIEEDYLTIRIKGKRNEVISLGKDACILPSTTIRELKEKITNKVGEAEKIIFSGYELTESEYDHKTLEDVGIDDRSMVTIVFRVRGGW